MGDRRQGRQQRKEDRRGKQSASTATRQSQPSVGVEAFGWTILAHPLFLRQVEKLVAAAEVERSGSTAQGGPNAKLLAHVLDLAFDRIPRDPGGPAFRHGGTLGADRRNWFRAKTGNGRYRLFYRFQSAARIIVYVWVNDETTLRPYGSGTDAYSAFAKMLNAGNPPDNWNGLVAAAASPGVRRLGSISKRHPGR